MRKPFVFIFVLLLGQIMWAGSSVIEDIIARVNDQIITRTDLNKAKEQALHEIKQQNASATESDASAKERESSALRDLIDQDLLLDKGKALGITGDTELIKRLDEMRKQMNLESMEDLEKAAQQQGVSFEDFKQNIRNGIITQEVISREVGSSIKITQQETQDYYNKHKSELQQPEAIRLSEILVAVPEQAASDDASVKAAQDKANQILKDLHSGHKFEDVAKKSSNGQTAAQGGDLGYFKRGELAKELEDKTFAMKPGDISDVIRTKQGFLILKVAEHHSAGIPPITEVQNQIQEQIYYQKLQPALRVYLTKLREDAYIDVKPGFVDTGASPNQTKPILTNGTDTITASSRKERKKKKTGLM